MAEHQRACASCGTTNEEDARFCEGCGDALGRTCGTCGVEANATARFCRACGAPLEGQVRQAPDASGPSRKTVTVMFADLAGSTTFEEQVDAETAREVMSRYHALLRTTAEHNRAGVTKYIGDGFMAVWGVPEIGPGDADRAVDAAVELQEHFVDFAARASEAHAVDLALRVAVNTGEVVVGAGDADLVGDALNVAARLEAECPRGRVVVGEETWRSTRGRHSYESLGHVQVKGRNAPVAVYQWLGRQSESTESPFVGRADEVRRLAAALNDAVAAQAARLVTVIGDPGVGKSRLAAEFTAALGDGRVVEARCDVEGTVALAPIVEVLRARDLDADVPAGAPERDRILRDLNGLTAGVPGSVEETFWALRRYIEMQARDEPLVIVVDDIQWADTLLLDFIEHLVEWVQDVPVLVLALARPELREVRPDLVTVSQWVTEAVHLGGLDPAATAELAAGVLGAARLPSELLGRLPSSTGGNPLFVRELVGMLVHDGVLVAEPAGWRLTIDVDAIAIPPTIQALLASRLERLNAADRRVLEIASVVGTDFSLGAICALAERGSAEVKGSLDRLRRLELAQPSGAYLGDEKVWRFHHVLIRDVAYRRLLKSDRADLHERLANWLEAGGASVAFDSDEMIARHLEAANGYRLELGMPGEHTGELALRSARRYLASARRALDRDELISAGTQAARGAALAAGDNAVHAELLLIGCEAFLSAGDVAAGAPLVDDLDRVAGDALAPWATCYRCQFIVYTDPDRFLEVEDRLQGAIDEFGRRRDPTGLAKAHRVRASTRFRLGRIGDAEVDLFEALIAARQGGDHRQITAALGAAPSAALWGPSPVPKAGGRCLDVVRMQRMTTAAPSLEATSLRCLAVLELLRGRPDKARSMLADARQVVADLGLRHGLMETELFAGFIESMVGDEVAAEPHFRTAMEGLDALGVGADAGQAAALLARSVLAQGRLDEADRYAAESERLAGHNLKTAIAWRAVRAEILAAQGMPDEAFAMANDAVAVAAGTDLVLDHAEACLALGRVLAAAGDHRGAAAARRESEALYEAKGAASSIGRVVEPPAPAAPTPEPVTSRLTITNRASEDAAASWLAMRAHDVDTLVEGYADRFVYDDRRRLSGDPITDRAAMRAAFERVFEQFTVFDGHTVAVRGERSVLRWNRWADNEGNETVGFMLFEADEDGRTIYSGRFDEDDFEGAYRELEHRYYAGEGAAFALNGHAMVEWMAATDRLDVEAARSLAQPDFRWLSPPSTLTMEERSVDDAFRWLEERARQVSSVTNYHSVVRSLSSTCMIGRGETRAIGLDGEEFEWTRIYVGEFRDGLLASIRQFELDDEDAAFAYAESFVARRPSSLAIANRASEIVKAGWRNLQAHNVDATVAGYSERFVFDDRRRLSGDPIVGLTAMRAALERIFAQYSQFELRVLAVRGERLLLASSRWSDDAGNETSFLHVAEVGDDGRTTYDGRFDADDFNGAYRELDRRYYSGEGAAFADAGAVTTGSVIAVNEGDLDRLFGEFASPGLRFENRSRSVFADRSIAEYRASIEELNAMVTSGRTWYSVLRWLSPTCCVSRWEREAVGKDGERYTWAWIYVGEARDGQTTTSCQFDLDDEEAAFAYAANLITQQSNRLTISNRASESADAFVLALEAHDVDGAVAVQSDRLVYDDRRRLSGDPIEGLAAYRTAVERVLEQYPRVEWHTVAVRGERLVLNRVRWSDDAGNEATYLNVFEVDDDGLITHQIRFDGDDFDGAYRELERRYYEGEGAAFAANGHLFAEWTAAMDRLDVEAARSLAQPEFRWQTAPSALTPADLSVDDLFRWLQARREQVSSLRNWGSAVRWPSPNCCVGVGDARAVGLDGEDYGWTRLCVVEFRDGLLASVRQFELDDEEAAFAYAETLVAKQGSRLTVSNRASKTVDAVCQTFHARDVDSAMAAHSNRFVYDDRRRLSGDPVEGIAAFRVASERFLEQYSHVEWRMHAVRGDRLALTWGRWSDDAGNESAYLAVFEVDDDGQITHHVRFDGDDFDGAYRELERRYYEGEGAPFALNGQVVNEMLAAMDRLDVDAARSLVQPEFRWLATPSAVISHELDGSVDEFFVWLQERGRQVSSLQHALQAMRWVSPNCCIALGDVRAIGLDGEDFEWTNLCVGEFRGGLLASVRQFGLDEEDAAFAYAESLVTPRPTSRLAVNNRAGQTLEQARNAMRANDAHTTAGFYADLLTYDDRRRISGDPIYDRAGLLAAAERILAQYNRFDSRTLAARGELLQLCWERWADDAGNETTNLRLIAVDDDGLIDYEGRFDEDDFEGAYRELERRYYAGEGAAFAANGQVTVGFLGAMDRLDVETARRLTQPEFRWLATPSALTISGDLSVDDLFGWLEERRRQVSSVRHWAPAIRWLSPNCCIGFANATAVGLDSEDYEWTRLYVVEFRDGLLTSIRQFELDDEEAAFAYAEERMRAVSSRLAVSNTASETMDRVAGAMQARDVHRIVECYADSFTYDDRRRLSGDPFAGRAALRVAVERILAQYTQFEGRTLAVRGERLQLTWTRSSDDAGNESTQLHLIEVDDDARIAYEGRFDGDDFEGAYRELDRRYYAGEGAAFAESGATLTEVVIAANRGELDRVFGEFAVPGLRFESRSHSVFPNRTVAELRSSLEELNDMVASIRQRYSAVCWLSPNWFVARQDREAVGLDGEKFEWTRLYVGEIRDGLATSFCDFDLEDEDAAFAYAEERMRAASSRLAVTNRATEVGDRLLAAFRERNVDAALDAHSDQFVYGDRRRLPGDPLVGRPGLRAAHERVFEQYSVFDGRTLAVRGERLQLSWSRWSDDAGNATTNLHVFELGDDGRISFHGRFEEDDFEDAYRELERRYYAGEGAAFAEAGITTTEWVLAVNRGDFDRAFGELSTRDLHIENRSRSAFPHRSATELRASFEELFAMVATARMWVSAVHWVSPTWLVWRLEREAIGIDGEAYQWLRLHAGEIQNGRLTSVCQFEVEDEDAAFAYAEERTRAASSPLALTNRATEMLDRLLVATYARDIDAAVTAYADPFVYDDRRRLSGDPITDSAGLRAANERILEQYNAFETRTLAVRGERLLLAWTRWSDDSGNESVYLHVFELDADGLIVYAGRFDEDDFEDAYRELERRYYAGEGSDYAEPGAVTIDWITGLNQGDFDKVFGELTDPELRVENRSRSAFPDRSGAAEFRAANEKLKEMVASARLWISALCWLSPSLAVGRFERDAVGRDGEQYAWSWVDVFELRDRRLGSMCRFELEDEDAAFAYAEERLRAASSRLALTNRATEVASSAFGSSKARDFDAVVAAYSDQFVFDDRRRLGGDPIVGRAALRAASERLREHYPHVELRTLAVRGERLLLASGRWSDDAGNETTYLHVIELDVDGRVTYDGRFDEDDFEGAYRELERRYYAGEGAAFAEAGTAQVEWITALNRGDLDRVGDLYAPEMRVENRSRTGFPDRWASDLRASFAELNAMVASTRTWPSAVHWVSPTWNVTRLEREAVGADGEHYEWTRLLVNEFRDGLVVSSCEFELDDEDAAFAYAEEQMRASSSALAVTNRASEVMHDFARAFEARDADAIVAAYSEQFVYDDRRRLSGDPIAGYTEMRAAAERVFEQYSVFESRTLAVRGERLELSWSRWSDDAGNATDGLGVFELGDDGRIAYAGRFDEDDFEGAYRELERRYYAGEGAAFAEGGAVTTEWITALNRGDFDRLLGELSMPEMRVEDRSRSAFPNRSAAELRASFEDLGAMVASMRARLSVAYWLSPTCCVGRHEREAVGPDGEQYAWTQLLVGEFRDGRCASIRQFELDDEDAAFAYAEERMRATSSRLTITNRSWETSLALGRALNARDVDGAMECWSDRLVYDDRRRLSGDPIHGSADLRTALGRILQQFNTFEWRILAVRGDRLNLNWSRWSDDAGNETSYLHVCEIDDDGRQVYEGRFDDDDFEGAYRELEHRYYAGEGAQFAEAGAVPTDWMIDLNRGDFDRAFGELITPDFRVENRSRSGFPDRSAAEFRASLEDLDAMMASTRNWFSATCWVSPAFNVCRYERETVGRDGEQYAWTWTRLLVCEVCDGRLASMCEFDDEDAAFAYAEERMRATSSRLALTNRASEVAFRIVGALQARDVDGAVAPYSDQVVYDDRRRLTGDPVAGDAQMRAATERILEQYSVFENRTLAVRGERLQLSWTRWSDDAGNETNYLHVFELGDNGRVAYAGRFDEEDFEGAYRELEGRYYAGEGAAFAEAGATGTDFMTALNQGDLDRAFGDLAAPGIRLKNRSRSGFPHRSAAEFRASLDELATMVRQSRTWNSAMCWLSPECAVARQQREAVGRDDEQYVWTRLMVSEIRDGRLTSACEFEVDDEGAAFAYAEERVRATSSRLAVANRASEAVEAGFMAMRARDIDGLVAVYSERIDYDDHRRLSGDPIDSAAAMRVAAARILEQYPNMECRILAVRGDRLELHGSRWSDDAGNEAAYLHVVELGDDGRITYDGRFDEDDFEGAYRELDHRYYAGEGAAYAESGATLTDSTVAINHGDFDRLLSDLSTPEMRVENRSRSAFLDRSVSDLRASFGELNAMVSSSRTWLSVVCWVSPAWSVIRLEREAVGHEGELYAWTRLHATEIRDGRIASMCLFEIDDEEAAFAYAEERLVAASSRLAVTNRATEGAGRVITAMRARDVDGFLGAFSDQLVYDDRRRLSGDPIEGRAGLRAATERIFEQYSVFEERTLAVRGERLQLFWSRWSDDTGNETNYLHVFELDDDGRIAYAGRFDEDDFEGAYRELDRRYYAGEGAAFAEEGTVQTDVLIALNCGDLDRVFNEFYTPEMRFEIRSRSAFPDRSGVEMRASLEEFNAWVESWRTWQSAMCWVSPTCCVIRNEREAVGRDGEQYAWTQIYVTEAREGRGISSCEFELEDEAAAFAYAEERMRAASSRLAVRNRASATIDAGSLAMSRHDVDSLVAFYADRFEYDDRRRLSGGPRDTPAALRAAVERLLEQYPHFEWRTLAVRGERLGLHGSRWWDDTGNEAAHLHVFEIGDAGRIVYDGRFDENDFESAYRELDRRYYAGEGAPFAEGGRLATEWVIAVNQGDFDRAFGELVTPGARVENRSRVAFPDPSVSDPGASFKDLEASVASLRTWNSAVCWVSPDCGVTRLEREAIGQDGETYTWTWLGVSSLRDGRLGSACMFDPEDEAAAFAYAEELIRATEDTD